MSLLLDALKRAEDAKRAKAEAASGAPASASVQDIAAISPVQLAEGLPATRALPDTTDSGSGSLAPQSDTPDADDIAPDDKKNVGNPLPDFPMLTLEQIDTRPPDAVTQSNLNPAAASSARTAIDRPAAPVKPTSDADASQSSRHLDSSAPKSGGSIGLSTNEFVLAELLKSNLSPDATAPNVGALTPPAAPAAFRAARSAATQPAAAVQTKSAAASMSLEDDEHFAEATTVATQTAQREAVKNVFAVKQAGPKGSKAKWAIPVIAISVAGVGAGGWYVWNEINKFSRPTIAKAPVGAVPLKPAAAIPPPVVAAGQPLPANSVQTADPTKVASTPIDTTKIEIPPALPPLLPPPAAALPVPKSPGKTGSSGATAAFTLRETLARKIEALPVPEDRASNAVMLRPATKAAQLTISPALAAGYAALSNGDFSMAKQYYAEAIAADTNNIDANLGFATAAARTGEVAMAERYYRRVLEIDPRNVTAATSLLTLAINSDALPATINLEGELRRLIALDPSVAASHFALGNYYAAQRRWSEAQPLFFEAARLAPQNPDYAYNLAVSLDQLGQAKTAADFYRRALGAKGQSQFDRAAVERRLQMLVPTRANQ